jgi:hypothetical protein
VVGRFLVVVLLIVMAVYLAYALIWAAPEGIRQVRGWWWLRRWHRARPHNGTVRELLEWLDHLRSPQQIRRLLHTVRIGEILRYDPHVGDLAQLLAAVERLDRYERRLAERQDGGIRGQLDRLQSPTAQPEPDQWMWWMGARGITSLRRTFDGQHTLAAVVAREESDSGPSTSSDGSSPTANTEIQQWLARMTAGRRQPLLYYDHTCRDELLLIIEQAQPTA